MRFNKVQKNLFENLFLRPKPVKMLTSLKNEDIKYATQVSKVVDCTYSHTVKVLEIFRKLGLVVFEKKGRIKIVRLTDEGLDVAHDFEGIRRKFHKMHKRVKATVSKTKK
ncbi:MAG: winged helix DNA-binding protein [Candidatus Aenigmarchaeota archaeon]|nr:winged helix DNA-binding protein [Candidatus Aenigmarchaeota archaeon]